MRGNKTAKRGNARPNLGGARLGTVAPTRARRRAHPGTRASKRCRSLQEAQGSIGWRGGTGTEARTFSRGLAWCSNLLPKRHPEARNLGFRHRLRVYFGGPVALRACAALQQLGKRRCGYLPREREVCV